MANHPKREIVSAALVTIRIVVEIHANSLFDVTIR
jgi:hypothetical protein